MTQYYLLLGWEGSKPKINITEMDLPPNSFKNSCAVLGLEQCTWSGTFFKRDHISLNDLFCNNTPEEL
jgi:hypothetical protein